MERSSCISVSRIENIDQYGHAAKSLSECISNTSLFDDDFIWIFADEEEITFAPTYRFERDTRDKYAYTKAKATGVSSRLLRCRYPVWFLSRTVAHTAVKATTPLDTFLSSHRTCFLLHLGRKVHENICVTHLRALRSI